MVSRPTMTTIASLLALLSWAAPATPAERMREFTLPTAALPSGIAVAPDGAVWVSVLQADKLLRFDPASGRFAEIKLPNRSHPRGLLVDDRGRVWYAASGLGHVARVAAPDARPAEFAIPAIAAASRQDIPSPWAIALDPRAREIWFTVHSDGLVGRVGADAEPVRRGFAVREIPLGGRVVRPEGIAVDGQGGVWVAELGADRLARVDARDGSIRRVPLAAGSRPWGVAVAPDGAVWITLSGAHQLVRMDPRSSALRAWPMPSAPRSSPSAVAVDAAGAVWVSEPGADAIARFDPATASFRVFALPTPRAGVHALAVGRPAGSGTWAASAGGSA
jgi:virginiamycin B lyase